MKIIKVFLISLLFCMALHAQTDSAAIKRTTWLPQSTRLDNKLFGVQNSTFFNGYAPGNVFGNFYYMMNIWELTSRLDSLKNQIFSKNDTTKAKQDTIIAKLNSLILLQNFQTIVGGKAEILPVGGDSIAAVGSNWWTGRIIAPNDTIIVGTVSMAATTTTTATVLMPNQPYGWNKSSIANIKYIYVKLYGTGSGGKYVQFSWGGN